MQIELELNPKALQAIQLFASRRAGKGDPNPNSALHLRYLNETTIRLAATNGQAIAIARLTTKSDLMESFYWPEEEQENAISFRMDAQALAAISKMGQRVTVSIGVAVCHIRPTGDGGGTSIEVVRVRGRQIKLPLFDDLESIKPVKAEELTERGQFTVNPSTLHIAALSAQLLGYGKTREQSLHLAIIGHSYGLTFGDENFWLLVPMTTTVSPKDGGLPPYWITSADAEASLSDTDAIDEMFEQIQADEEKAAEEQKQLEFASGDEHAPTVIPDSTCGDCPHFNAVSEVEEVKTGTCMQTGEYTESDQMVCPGRISEANAIPADEMPIIPDDEPTEEPTAGEEE